MRETIINTPEGLVEAAVPIYERYASLLGDKLRPEDSGTLAQLAVLESIAVESAREIETNGATEKDHTHAGEMRRSSSFAVLKQSIELATKLKVQLGITPKMRRAMKEEGDSIDFEAMLYGGN